MSSEHYPFYYEVAQAYRAAQGTDNFLNSFTRKIQGIFRELASDGFDGIYDVPEDMQYYMDKKEEFNWTDDNLIKFVADYIDKGLGLDYGSIQNDKRETIMKLITE